MFFFYRILYMLQASSEDCYFIAEIGQNHQGNIEIAKQLIMSAAEKGVNCVKFQKSHLSSKFNSNALAWPYNSKNSWGKTYGDHKRYLELTENDYIELQAFATSLSVDFTASAMDLPSLYFLHSLKVPFIKIGSGDAENIPLLTAAAALHIPLVISTGMCSIESVKRIYNIISKEHKNFVLMHCTSSYPTPENELNLNVIETYKQLFPDVIIG